MVSADDRLDARPRRTGPAWIVSIALVVAVAVSATLIVAAQRLPALPFGLEVSGGKLVNDRGEEVTALRASPEATAFRIEAVDVIEEPDVLDSWEELDAFYQRQAIISRHLAAPSVEVEVGGQWSTTHPTGRALAEIPLAFYTLLAAALIAWIVGFLTYAFSDRGLAARIYVVSAVAFSIAVWPAALYSTRPLAIDADAFRWLSTADHVGALVFAAGVIGILAVYPVRLVRSISWLWIMAGVAGVIGHLQLGEMWLSGFYTANVVQFVLFLAFAGWQWRASRHLPLQRAALGWILLSMFVGVIFFLSLITLPVLLGTGPAISQTTGLVSIVFMYAGISLGVLRFRLFDLDRWWFRTWAWILSGIAVIGIDLVLSRVFDVTANVALVVALIVAGWVYFPVRQRLFERFARTHKPVAFDVRALIGATTEHDLRTKFEAALRSSFSPLEIEHAEVSIARARLAGDGAWLEVPSPAGAETLRCRLRDNGARLYSSDDVARATELVALGEAVRSSITARTDGELAERARIRRDLHDDLGASIIRIAHEARDDHTAQLAKDAMRDLRDVLTALHDAPTPCLDLLEDVEAELRTRVVAAGRELHWTLEGTTSQVLSARSCTNLTRALREAMTNALRHGAGSVQFGLSVDTQRLHVTISNGRDQLGPVEPGVGIANIESRLRELRGKASFAAEGDRFVLELELPWSNEP